MQKTSAQSGKRSSLFLNSFSCTRRQGLFLHLASYKIHPSLLFYRLPALYHKLFTAEVWVNLAHTGNKMLFSSGYVFRASRRLHAPIFSSSCSACPFSPSPFVSLFLFFLLSPPPYLSSSLSAPYGATACVNSPLGPFCTAAQ